MSTHEDHKILLQPIGVELTAARDTPLRGLLFEHGVEFPCGGQGRCRGCRVRVRGGRLGLNEAQRERLTPEEVAAGWRLACQCWVEGDLILELRQWDASILTDDAAFTFTPQEGLGVAVDLGTTTLVAQLLDLSSGHVLAVRTALNPQARYGADVMSRVQFAVAEGGQSLLEEAIRHSLGGLVHQLLHASHASTSRLRRVVLVGNAVMHHLFCGIDLEPLSHYPFEPVHEGLQTFTPEALGWALPDEVTVQFLPCLGGFVGSDILAGILATRLHESRAPSLLIDLGTNGEIVVGDRERMLCASTAAGPAFEGARISMGMRAATGAIWRVFQEEGALRCETLGSGAPQGLCGSGLVDAVAVGLELGLIQPSGRLARGEALSLTPTVALTQSDIRQLQLAKGAIAAGVQILLQRWGVAPQEVAHLYLAGAFGNYIDRASARRIGLLDFPLERIQPVGNAALLGAKMALFAADDTERAYVALRNRIDHLALSADPRFQDIYVEKMSFPLNL